MFDCKRCDALQSEVEFLREQLKSMTDRLTAIASTRAFEAVRLDRSNTEEFYGSSSQDQYVHYNEFGDKVLLEKKIEIT